MLMNEIYETINKIYESINKIYESRDVISIKSLKNMLENCPEIEKIDYDLLDADDIECRPVYSIKFYEINYNQVMYLWFYFYDDNNIAIQQIFGMDNPEFDINYGNGENPEFDFDPVEVDRQYL